MTVICPICKEKLYGFEWKKTQNDANWMQNELGEWHNCPMNQKNVEQKHIRLTKYDYKKCIFCTGFFLFNEYDDHIRKWHPNDELLTDEAFRVIEHE